MSYTMLDNKAIRQREYAADTLEGAALAFIRESCEGLRFDKRKATTRENSELDSDGTSLKKNQIPFNMEKDIDRLCLENAIDRFLKSGKKEDAFDVYYCYLEMFVGDYEKTRRMIELLSEYEANGSSLLMKHRDHYSHSVYVFILGLAIFQSNCFYRNAYKKYYGIQDEQAAAAHYLQYWGLSSLFHDIGYPFELPFEQVCSYFEVNGVERSDRPFIAYFGIDKFTRIDKSVQRLLGQVFSLDTGKILGSTDELFAFVLHQKLGDIYYFSEQEMLRDLQEKSTEPNKFGYFMDHAYFSATVLLKKLFEEVKIYHNKSWDVKQIMDSLTAILLHNSLYKFSIAFYKNKDANIRLKAEWHPIAYMLMLCDELQCWDRKAYGRNSRLELHPMDCRFRFTEKSIEATYIFDRKEEAKINRYLKNKQTNPKAKLKVYSSYDRTEKIVRESGEPLEVTEFQADIERIVDLGQIDLKIDKELADARASHGDHISDSRFINLYHFACVLNWMWSSVADWKSSAEGDRIEEFLSDEKRVLNMQESFGCLSLEYQLSNIGQAKAFSRYLHEIGCFYTDRDMDCEMVERFTTEDLKKIGPMEHQRWLQAHYDMGWTYGNPDNRELERKHKDMIPGFTGFDVSCKDAEENYGRLDKAEQEKDTDPMNCMLAMLRMFDGLRIYRL